MLEIVAIPAFNDNYMWLGVNHELQQAFVVDPGESAPVLAYLRAHNLTLAAILATHKHADHTGGIRELVDIYNDVPVYGNAIEKTATVTHNIGDGDVFTLPMWSTPFEVIFIPGHTLGHVAYYAKPALFCGDTLFSAGCGRVFEGTAGQMLASLEKLAALPEDTLVYCGHEYTLANLQFAALVEPGNVDVARHLKSVEKLRHQNYPTLPSSIRMEKLINPFLRCDRQSVVAAVEVEVGRGLPDKVSVFHELREWKNRV